MGYVTKILGGMVLAGYAVVLMGGFDFGTHQRTVLAPNVRQSPGGYRAWGFWHSGSSGGK